MNDTLAKLERRLHNPWPLRGRERTIYALVGCALCAGAIASCVTKSPDWLARFGSLIVVIGIYFAWLDLSGTVTEVKKYQRAQMDNLLVRLRGKPRVGLIKQAQNMKEQVELSENAAQIDRILVRLGKRVKALEAFTIALGTLVNGFGTAFPL